MPEPRGLQPARLPDPDLMHLRSELLHDLNYLSTRARRRANFRAPVFRGGGARAMTLYEVMRVVQLIDALANGLPDIGEVIDGMDAYELQTEREGGQLPRDAIQTLRPVIIAVGELQKVCRQRRADHAARHAKPPEVSLG